MSTQRLVARIKRSSKYAYQAPGGTWFFVVVDKHGDFRGNNNVYRTCDLAFGVMIADTKIIDLNTGKIANIVSVTSDVDGYGDEASAMSHDHSMRSGR